MRPVYVSLSAMGMEPVSCALTQLWEAGVRGIELALGPRYEPCLGSLVLDYQSKGVDFRAHHAFPFAGQQGGFDLSSPLDLRAMEARLDWLREHGIKVYSVHAGSHDEGEDREQAYALFLEQLGWLDACCQDRGITLGVETMFAMPPSSRRANLLVGLDEIDRFLRGNEHVPLVVDLAHLGLWPHDSIERRLEVFHLARGRILEVHVSDNDGRRDLHSAISPEAWWWPFCNALPEAIPVVVETRIDGPGRPSLEAQLVLLSGWLLQPEAPASGERARLSSPLVGSGR